MRLGVSAADVPSHGEHCGSNEPLGVEQAAPASKSLRDASSCACSPPHNADGWLPHRAALRTWRGPAGQYGVVLGDQPQTRRGLVAIGAAHHDHV